MPGPFYRLVSATSYQTPPTSTEPHVCRTPCNISQYRSSSAREESCRISIKSQKNNQNQTPKSNDLSAVSVVGLALLTSSVNRRSCRGSWLLPDDPRLSILSLSLSHSLSLLYTYIYICMYIQFRGPVWLRNGNIADFVFCCAALNPNVALEVHEACSRTAENEARSCPLLIAVSVAKGTEARGGARELHVVPGISAGDPLENPNYSTLHFNSEKPERLESNPKPLNAQLQHLP